MKRQLTILFFPLLCACPVVADTAVPGAERVMLDAMAIENLRIAIEPVEVGEFEETVFALGRIAVYPGRRAVVSSRIPGRVREMFLKPDHRIEQGAPALVIESRQFAEPPPTVTLAAPISGLVSAVHVVQGQPVGPDDVLAEIVDLSEVYALAQVPEYLVGQLQRGQLARITTAAVPGQVFEATLEHFGAEVQAESGTLEAAFHVDNPELLLRPGMRAEFSIVVGSHKGVLSVPRVALQGGPAGRFVYVRDANQPHAFIRTPVVTGRMNERGVEIVRGLEASDVVVTRGAYSLAFAGGGSLSLKEALDAAHGHAHNPDGTEIGEGHSEGHDNQRDTHGDAHAHDEHEHSPLWMIVSAVLAVLLVLVSLWKRRDRENAVGQPSE